MNEIQIIFQDILGNKFPFYSYEYDNKDYNMNYTFGKSFHTYIYLIILEQN